MSYFETCPRCGSDDITGNRRQDHARCESCGFVGEGPEASASQSSAPNSLVVTTTPHPLVTLANEFPLPLALPVIEYTRAGDPFVKLHRLVDSAELLTRMCAMICLSDVLRSRGEFPAELRRVLADKLERPTFGVWKEILALACDALPRRQGRVQCFVSEIPAYVKVNILPYLGSGEAEPTQTVLALRNVLAHGGRLSGRETDSLLAAHQSRFEGLVAQAEFLARYTLVAVAEDDRILQLRGVYPAGVALAETDFGDLSKGAFRGRLMLVRAADGEEERLLDLFPLQAFTDVFQWRDDTLKRVGGATAQMYLRASGLGHLEFTTVSESTAVARQQGLALERFREVYRLEEWRQLNDAERQRRQLLFADLVADLGEVFVGRETQIRHIKQCVKDLDQGVLWLGGAPGVGKSAIMARLVQDYQHATPHLVLIPYFFRLGHSGCSTDHFVRAALLHLAVAREETLTPAPTEEERREQLITALRRASEHLGKKVLFLIDGLDEISRLEPDFLSLLFAARTPNVLWLCAGRSDSHIEETLREKGATLVFQDGVPLLDEGAIRGMLTQRLEQLKYTLFARDREENGVWYNRFVEQLVHKSQGLPLYVTMAIEDLRQGKWTLYEEEKLPDGLPRYFEQIFEQLGVSDHGTILTPLMCFLAWAKEPITESSLRHLLHRHYLRESPRWEELFARALAYGHPMLRQSPTSDGAPGWTLFHDAFRQHVLTSHSIQDNREWTRRTLLDTCAQWQSLSEASLRQYALRHYAAHLREAQRWNELFALARSEDFFIAQRHAFPTAPDLPLRTLQLALEGPATQSNAEAIAEFMRLHALEAEILKEESPLEALRAGNWRRAWELADLHEPRHRVLWHLLLAWELYEHREEEKSRTTLQRLRSVELPKLTGWQSHTLSVCARHLLPWMIDMFSDEFFALQKLLFSDSERSPLCQQLWSDGHFALALTVARDMSAPSVLCSLLETISAHSVQCEDQETQSALFKHAHELAAKLSEPQWSAKALVAVGLMSARMGEVEGACTIFRSACLTMHEIPSPIQIEDLLRVLLSAGPRIDNAQVRSSLAATVVEEVRALRDPEIKARALEVVAEALVPVGEQKSYYALLAEAVEAAGTIDDAYTKVLTLASLAYAQQKRGDQGASLITQMAALQAVEQVADELMRRYALEMVVTQCAHLEVIVTARDIARRFGVRVIRGVALAVVATALAKAGQFDKAMETIGDIESEEESIKAQITLAELQAYAGEHEAARGNFAAARSAIATFVYDAIIPPLPGKRPSSEETARETARLQSRLLADLASAQTRTGDLDAAFVTAQEIVAGADQERVFIEIARAENKVAHFTAALTVIAKIQDVKERTNVLKEIASAQQQAGELKAASETARLITDQEIQAHLFVNIAEGQAQGGEFRAGWETARSIGSPGHRKRAVKAVMAAVARYDEKTIEDAIATIRAMGNAKECIAALATLSVALDQSGNKRAAERAWAYAFSSEDETVMATLFGLTAAEKYRDDVLVEHLPPVVPAPPVSTPADLFAVAVAHFEERDYAAARSDLATALRPVAGLTRSERERAFTDSEVTPMGKTSDGRRIYMRVQFPPTRWSAARRKIVSAIHRVALCARIRAGEVDAVLADLQKEQDEAFRYEALRAVTFELAKLGKVEEAEAIAQTHFPLADIELKIALANAAARSRALAGDFAGALTVGQGSEEASIETALLAAHKGRFGDALDAVWTIADTRSWVLTLKAILTMAARRAEPETALTACEDARDLVREMERRHAQSVDEPLAAIAMTQAWLGAIGAARETVNEIHDDWGWHRGKALKAVALAQARVGVYDDAIVTANEIEDQGIRMSTLAFLSQMRATAQGPELNHTAFDAGIERTWGLMGEEDYYAPLGELETTILAEIAAAQARAGERELATVAFESARARTWWIEDEEKRADMLASVSMQQARSGFVMQAVRTATAILHNRSHYLPKIALALAEAGDTEQLHELMIPCAYDLHATYGFCEALACTYPEQLTGIARALVGEAELLAYRFTHPGCGF